jgi:hypothetical protein
MCTVTLPNWVSGGMSALPPKADMVQPNPDVRFVPKADVNARGFRWALAAPKSRNSRIPILPPQTAETPDIGSSLAWRSRLPPLVRIVGEDADDFHAGLDLGIGCVDDAERHVADGGAGESDYFGYEKNITFLA